MYKITHIESLGTDYTVANKEGKILTNIQIIQHTEILEAALGEYNPDKFDNISDYMAKSIAVLEGNEDIDPLSIGWYASSEEEVSISNIVEFAIKNKYKIIIIENLPKVTN